MILPRTGERVKRTVTLRDPDYSDLQNGDGAAGERAPLLGHRGSEQASRRGKIATVWVTTKDLITRGYVSASSKTGQSILKCALAYLLVRIPTMVIYLAL